MPFVVDASITASWLLPDERPPEALHAYARLLDDTAVVPSLWWFEIRNVFISNERRGRIDSGQTGEALSLLAGLPIQLDHECVEVDLFSIARRHGLTIYDAAYLELAKRFTYVLATLDQQLAVAARAERVALLATD
jgi:predicted nucleic acid-binding protein